MKELPRQQSDRVATGGSARVELVAPAEILEDLSLGPEDAVLGPTGPRSSRPGP